MNNSITLNSFNSPCNLIGLVVVAKLAFYARNPAPSYRFLDNSIPPPQYANVMIQNASPP